MDTEHLYIYIYICAQIATKMTLKIRFPARLEGGKAEKLERQILEVARAAGATALKPGVAARAAGAAGATEPKLQM